jgi:hypothetical protein
MKSVRGRAGHVPAGPKKQTLPLRRPKPHTGIADKLIGELLPAVSPEPNSKDRPPT